MKIRTVYQVVEHHPNEWGATSLFFYDTFSERENAKRDAENRARENPDSLYHLREVTFYDEQDDE